ncbi:MAG: DUF502 domain-containing protein [Phycisphaerales bacterium]
MSDQSARTFTGDFKRFFLRGLVVLLPSVLTLWIVVKAYQFVDNSVAQPINRSIRLAMVKGSFVYEPLRERFDPSGDAVRSELFNRIQRGEVDNASMITSREMMQSVIGGDESVGALIRMNPSLPDRLVSVEEQIRLRLRRENISQWWQDHWYLDFFGLLVAVIAVYFAGRLLGGFFGRQMYKRIEALITQLPIFKQVYPSVKQIVDFLFGDEQPIKFNRVVTCEYPRKGIWSVGFLTGDSLRNIENAADDQMVTVFIPSSPTPFTGYTISVPKRETRELPLTVDEAIRFAVSGGVLVPNHQVPTRSLDPANVPDGVRELNDLKPAALDPADELADELGDEKANGSAIGPADPIDPQVPGRPTGSPDPV